MGAATTAKMTTAATAVAATALGEARRRQRKDQRYRCRGAQNSQTFHVQTPYSLKQTS
jgi:hypothetical protein